VLLVPRPCDRDQSAVRKAHQRAVHRAGAGIRQRDDLGAPEAPFRLAEEKREHPLLYG
jgi:hypothetical protein